MRKIFVNLLFALSCSLAALSQEYVALANIDSLKKILLVAKDTQRINTLNLLSMRVIFGGPSKDYLEIAESFSQEALTLSKKINYRGGIGGAMLNEGIISMRKYENYSGILASLQVALPLLKESKNEFYVAGCYGYIADCFHVVGQNQKAVLFYDSSVHLFQQLGDTTSSVWQMVGKGHSYYDLGNYNFAYKVFHIAQDLTQKRDTLLQNVIRINLAKLFLSADLPEIAIDYTNQVRRFYPILSIEQQKDLPWTLSGAYMISGEAFLKMKQTDSALKMAEWSNLPMKNQDVDDLGFYGRLYYALGEYNKALVYFSTGYRASRNSSHKISLASHAVNLSNTYIKLKNFPKAIYYANEAVAVSREIDALFVLKNATGALAGIYRATKNYKKAYEYDLLYKTLSDSLAPEDYRRKLSLIQIQHELEGQQQLAQLLSKENLVKQQTLKIQQQQLMQASLLKKVLIGSFCAFVLLSFFVFRNIMLKRKNEKDRLERQLELQQLETEKARIEFRQQSAELEMQALRAQMNPHFIFNCLSSINRYILINRTEEASAYLTKFSRLIRMALHNSEKPLVTLENELEALRLYLDLERLRFKNAFNYSVAFVNAIDINAVYIPPMLIQPFAENAIWHGLMHKQGVGLLEIQLCAENKTLTCVIMDNGIGRNMSGELNTRTVEKNKSMGVEITRGRLALLNRSRNEDAVFAIEDLLDNQGNGCGTKVILKMPYRDMTEILTDNN